MWISYNRRMSKLFVTGQSMEAVSLGYNLDTVLVIVKRMHCQTDLVYTVYALASHSVIARPQTEHCLLLNVKLLVGTT